jgi:hypothetical protein
MIIGGALLEHNQDYNEILLQLDVIEDQLRTLHAKVDILAKATCGIDFKVESHVPSQSSEGPMEIADEAQLV